MFNVTDLVHTLPISILVITGMILMLMEAFKARNAMPWVAGLGLLASAVMAIPAVMSGLVSEPPQFQGYAFGLMMRITPLAQLVHILLVASAFFTLFFVGDFLKRQEKPIFDIYPLLVFCTAGMVMLANANNLIMTFIGLETMSICLYIMASLFKKDLRSNEAGLKYFLLGAFATGFFLFGVALIYGGSGEMNLSQVNWGRMLDTSLTPIPLFYPAVGMLLIGFLFKVAAFPFHMWTPDVYSGAPTPLAGFMATGAKAAAFIAFASIIGQDPLIFQDKKISIILISIAVLTMIYGNIVAARQTNLKRMLAYSSIAHSGYVLLAVAAGTETAFLSVIFYMLVYTLMNIGAFGLIGMAESRFEDGEMDAWNGIGRKYPWFGAAMSLFLFSLAGIPPLAGFMGKYFVFVSAIDAGFLIPAIIGVLTSVVGAYYYIRVIRNMFFDDKAEPSVQVNCSKAPMTGLILLAVLIIVLGIGSTLVQTTLTDAAYGPGMTAAAMP